MWECLVWGSNKGTFGIQKSTAQWGTEWCISIVLRSWIKERNWNVYSEPKEKVGKFLSTAYERITLQFPILNMITNPNLFGA